VYEPSSVQMTTEVEPERPEIEGSITMSDN
jgi:hypothetical protein